MKKVLAIVFIVVIAWLQYRAWYGENGLDKIEVLEEKIADQVDHNQSLAEQNLKLRKEIDLIRKHPKVLEEKAREHLGLVKKGEIFYRIIPAEDK